LPKFNSLFFLRTWEAILNISVNQQTAVLQGDQPRSFEEAIDLIRRQRAQEEQKQDATPESTDGRSGDATAF
jgi:hypothetical protein